ncbi:MAG TPA: metalloregulator ArsR/SmtB family transcription factor [Dongiaceae bacterium]|jgi:uncharacterized protein YndB with AHSA1/START domain/DNA-binding transcriptional ArsR family regulator|nr:metalloregulator ArsR/SmtB family transcription factor [Dongiaceae bacterium]
MSDQLSMTLAALADPTRRAILARLHEGHASVSTLAAPFAMSLPAISKHIKVLERAGLVRRERVAQSRPCRLEAAPLKEVAGWLETYRRDWGDRLDRFENYLETLTTEKMMNKPEMKAEILTLTRTFHAPRETVFRAWTDPEHFKRWWGPRGFTVPYCTIDLRVGGKIHFCMRGESGPDIWCAGIYQEITPERLVSTDFFSDKDGNRVSPLQYGMKDFPEERLLTVTFIERDGKTTLTLMHTIPLDMARTMGADAGWGQSFDKLAEYLVQS